MSSSSCAWTPISYQSSLALSLGLVGALSIVRFRAAIKEPEELVFLFLSIAVGLGLGAGQALLTIVAMIVIVGVIALRSLRRKAIMGQNLFLTVAHSDPAHLSASQILDELSKAGITAELKRFDEGPESLRASFLASLSNAKQIEAFSHQIRQRIPAVEICCLDDRGAAL